MAGILDELTLGDEYVISPLNLTMFLKWAETASEDDIDDAISVIYTTEHTVPAWQQGVPQSPPVLIQRADLGLWWAVNQVTCTEPQCRRCTTGRGGWNFRWIGPWTCPEIIGDSTMTPAEMYDRANRCQCGRH